MQRVQPCQPRLGWGRCSHYREKILHPLGHCPNAHSGLAEARSQELYLVLPCGDRDPSSQAIFYWSFNREEGRK